LLHRAPAPWARWMCMVNKRLTRGRRKPLLHDAEAAPCRYLTFPIFLRVVVFLRKLGDVVACIAQDAQFPAARSGIGSSKARCHPFSVISYATASSLARSRTI